VEKAEASIKGADAERMAERMLANKFDFNDFMDQSRMMGQMGSMGQMMKMIPGARRFGCALCRVFAAGYHILQLVTRQQRDVCLGTGCNEQHLKTVQCRWTAGTPSFGSGMSKISDKQMAQAEKKIKESEAMIRSMTPQASPAEAPSGEPIACCLSGDVREQLVANGWSCVCWLSMHMHAATAVELAVDAIVVMPQRLKHSSPICRLT
jgi:Signal peptide binding domain